MARSRLTKQKRAVLEAVLRSRTHPDAAAVYQEARSLLPRISLGTVYRCLESLTEEGKLLRIQGAKEAARYDAKLDHAHRICQRCGIIEDVAGDQIQISDLSRQLVTAAGSFQVREVAIELRGLCAACQEQLGFSEAAAEDLGGIQAKRNTQISWNR
jgi:Fur family ferric uptake transcriptional regulator